VWERPDAGREHPMVPVVFASGARALPQGAGRCPAPEPSELLFVSRFLRWCFVDPVALFVKPVGPVVSPREDRRFRWNED